MEPERIQELLMKYQEGQADPSEVKEIEKLIEEGVVNLEEIPTLNHLQQHIMSMSLPQPTAELDYQFQSLLQKVKAERKGFSWSRLFSWPELAPRLAFASVTLFIGLVIGFYLLPDKKNDQVEVLTQQVSEMKEMMMLTLLEKESATERLKAVSLTQEMDQVSSTVTQALIQTLNQDENVNVRLAALDALRPYVKSSAVRQELVKSIAKQDSPLVQVALAELMAAIQEKSSVKEFEKLLKSDRTPVEIKKRIEESIDVMI
jgi:hypothetical protein